MFIYYSKLKELIYDKEDTHFLDTDNYYGLPTNPPFTMPRVREERITLMEKDIISAEKVVITGSLCGWGMFLFNILIC